MNQNRVAEHSEDLAFSVELASAFWKSVRDDEFARRRERSANLFLMMEWFLLLGLTYTLIYAVKPWTIKVAILIPWSIYASLAFDNIAHYLNHWPPFRRKLPNLLWRVSGIAAFLNPLEIRYVHGDHHRSYAKPDIADCVFDLDTRGKLWTYFVVETVSSLKIFFPFRQLPAELAKLRKRRPLDLWEIMFVRWALFAWITFLLVFDFWNTFLFLVPSMIIVASFASLVMNLTDHIPGDPRDPFRLATYLEPRTRLEKLLCAINHYTAATHLTHHLFPHVHWVHLRELQTLLAPTYEKHGAPSSLIVNTFLIGNLFRVFSILQSIKPSRFAVTVT